jgi:hypothetical protein
MASRHVHSLLTPGRVVLYLNPITGLTELALVCGGPEHVEAATASRASRWGGVLGLGVLAVARLGASERLP